MKSIKPYYLKVIRESIELKKQESVLSKKYNLPDELEFQIIDNDKDYDQLKDEVLGMIRKNKDKINYQN